MGLGMPGNAWHVFVVKLFLGEDVGEASMARPAALAAEPIMSRSIIKKQSSNADVKGDSSSRNKSVHFDPAARFILIRPSNEYATGDRSSPSSLTRYTDDDYKRIRKGVKKTVRAVRTFHEEYPDGNFDEYMCKQSLAVANEGEEIEPKYCARGLEHLRTAEYLEQQMINKDCAIEAVLVAHGVSSR